LVSSRVVPYPKPSPTTITYYHCLILLLRLSCPSYPTQASYITVEHMSSFTIPMIDPT
jgi:hypothetical protein